MSRSTPSLPVHHQLLESTQTLVHRVSDAIHHLVLCLPLILLPSIFPSIRVFSNESALHIRWPKYWCFSLSISSSNVDPGLISFRMNWLDLLWNSAFRCLNLSLSPLLFTSLLFTALCKASPDSHFAFLHFFYIGMVLIADSCTMSRTSVHNSSGTLVYQI